MSVLYLVATPIGNLEDLTFRAARLLAEVDLIVAEDTRQTKILLNKYGIKTPLTSYHKFNIKEKTDYLLALLQGGKTLALVSDSGMPLISDPGYELVCSAVVSGVTVVPVPGSSASLAALVVSGLPTDKFIFEGFLPKKPGKKRKVLEALKELEHSIIIYESPYRVLKTLIEVQNVLGERQVAVCRELTKKFEEIIRGKVGEVIEQIKDRRLKGEVVMVIEGLR
ncbi:16S rRNA (cytidine(1402)-2'-O)-methyltransferase [Candidatus Saganbacteria bacterium CG08_land_8_20_14_0_20_45_16]|uniref:Ribosomal RNA small subunit methyltransferase I n=1 Tax=Candidatus Saganbacteria bacterium CG08_land_8_20_14_0_20_45_16 TaxID=2014293 RepID=A0A2H0XVN6_UNCSA|nr:MAG: 16S rRNA (cytidine(1402)-2'-O)-methyltransferase [Candidatus Saganbacteria bacterium CG08_land_8_20_14_0_20_45_16]